MQGSSAEKQVLKPILLSGGGRTGSTAIMSMLGTDARVAFDREYPFESRYLLYFVKLGMLLERPDLFQFIVPEQLFEYNYIGFGGPPPGPGYVPQLSDGLPHPLLADTTSKLWSLFSENVRLSHPAFQFHAEKAPVWLAPIVREFMQCYTIYNFRDPRDIFISANAFMKKRNYMGFARTVEDTDVDHARHIALAFINTFENYCADRQRSDTMLLRYEDFALHREKVANDIRQLCDLEVKVNSGFEFFSTHRTAKDLQHSVDRWKSDPIPEDVTLFLERSLRDEMLALGYPISRQQPDDPCKKFSFVRGGIDPSSLACSSHGYFEEQEDGEAAIVNIRGEDFWIILPILPFEAESVKEVWVSVQGEIGQMFSLYFNGPDQDFSEERCLSLPYTPSPHWSVLSFPVHRHEQWRGIISYLRLDLFNAINPAHHGRGRIRWIRLVG
jgi:hypothetical protein